MLIFKKYLKGCYGALIIIITFLLMGSSLLYAFLEMDHGSRALQFLRGWSFSSAQIILVTQFPRLYHKICFIIIGFAVRYGIIGYLDSSVFGVDIIIRNVLADIFVIYIYYSHEKKDRQIFQDFFEYREELTKFKDLIDNYFPQSILILNSSTKEPVFSNQDFFKFFEYKRDVGTNRESFRPETRSIQQLALKVLEFIIPQINTIRWSGGGSQQSLSLFQGADMPNLKSLVGELIENDFFKFKAVMFTGSYAQDDCQKSYEITLMPITWDTHKAIAIILNDITYQEKLLALKQADMNKDLVIRTLSHELRTPLNGIIGILDIAQSSTQEPEINRFLSLCRDNANLLLTLVDSILDLQRVFQKNFRLQPSIINLHKLLQDTIGLFIYQVETKGLTLNLKISENVPTYVYNDGQRIKQILVSLIGNAIKFTFSGGIEVKAIQDDTDSKFIKISISDTGIGIKEEYKSKLFTMYGNLEGVQGGVSKNGGGLGLTIANALARLVSKIDREQSIEMQSEYGKGSNFIFRILENLEQGSELDTHLKRITSKAEDGSVMNTENVGEDSVHINLQDYDELSEKNHLETKLIEHQLKKRVSLEKIFRASAFQSLSNSGPTPRIEKKESYDSLISKQGKHVEYQEGSADSVFQTSPQTTECDYVLIVDDNPFNLLVAQHCVEILGYKVITAISGEQAIDKIRLSIKFEKKIKFILMDCQMPVMDGFETTVQLRKIMESKEIYSIPIIALTANNTEEDIRKCFECGMVSHLAKPLHLETLRKCLTELGLDPN